MTLSKQCASLFLSASLIVMLGVTSCNNDSKTPQDNKGSKNSTGEPTEAQNNLALDTNAKEALPADQKIISSLDLKLADGEVYRYHSVATDDFTQGDSIKVTSLVEYYYTKKIKSAKDGLIELTMRYDSIKAKTVSSAVAGQPAQNMTYSSNNEADKKSEKYDNYNVLIGEEVTVTMTSKGKIEEISGITGLLNKMLKSKKDSIPAAYKSQLADQIKAQAYMQVLMQESQTQPEKGIDSTQQWKREYVLPIPPFFESKNKTLYSISDVSMMDGRKVAVIKASMNGVISAAQKVPIKLTIGKASAMNGVGTSYVDVDKGYTIMRDNVITSNVVVSATDPQSKQVQTIKQSTRSSFKVELIK